MNNFKRYGLVTLIVLRAFWKSTVEIAWGISGLILFGGLMLQYDVALTTVAKLFEINRFLMNKWIGFWLVFWILSIYDNWWRIKEVSLGEKK